MHYLSIRWMCNWEKTSHCFSFCMQKRTEQQLNRIIKTKTAIQSTVRKCVRMFIAYTNIEYNFRILISWVLIFFCFSSLLLIPLLYLCSVFRNIPFLFDSFRGKIHKLAQSIFLLYTIFFTRFLFYFIFLLDIEHYMQHTCIKP